MLDPHADLRKTSVSWIYHDVGIAVHRLYSPLNTPEATPRWMECCFSYPAIRCGTRNFKSATNWLKHKADWFYKWYSQGAKSNRAKAVPHEPLHGGKNWKKWNFWLHWQKQIVIIKERNTLNFFFNYNNDQKRSLKKLKLQVIKDKLHLPLSRNE